MDRGGDPDHVVATTMGGRTIPKAKADIATRHGHFRRKAITRKTRVGAKQLLAKIALWGIFSSSRESKRRDNAKRKLDMQAASTRTGCLGVPVARTRLGWKAPTSPDGSRFHSGIHR